MSDSLETLWDVVGNDATEKEELAHKLRQFPREGAWEEIPQEKARH